LCVAMHFYENGRIVLHCWKPRVIAGIDGIVCWNRNLIIVIFFWLRKTNFHFPLSVFHLQQINGSSVSSIFPIYKYIWPFQMENRSPCNFPVNPFIVCSSCKRKFVVCPFVYEETNRSYPFANGLNGLAHLCRLVINDHVLVTNVETALTGVTGYFFSVHLGHHRWSFFAWSR
jgi:hypothetical protein